MFKFTIRELVLVTVIAALVVAWLIDRRDLKGRVNALFADLQQQGDYLRKVQDEALRNREFATAQAKLERQKTIEWMKHAGRAQKQYQNLKRQRSGVEPD
jgi:hypothetical protein